MALINLIDETDYVVEWKGALDQYFRMVRVFNPMQANFSQHIALLESMSQLKEEWTTSVKQSVEIFIRYREQKINDSAELIMELLSDTLSYVASSPIATEEASKREQEEVLEQYKKHLRGLEEQRHRSIAKVWNHSRLEKEAPPLFEDLDLFGKESASLFGLSKKEMIVTGATGGALAGSGIDLMLGGTSLMMGSAIGALLGGVGAMFGFDEIGQVKILGQTLGNRYIAVGPMQNKNFPYMLLRRALYYTQEIANRPHADRSKIRMDSEILFSTEWIDSEQKKSLEKLHQNFRSGNAIKEKHLDTYCKLIQSVLLGRIELYKFS